MARVVTDVDSFQKIAGQLDGISDFSPSTWAPFYGASSGTFTSVTTSSANYWEIGGTGGNWVYIELVFSGTTSTSTSRISCTTPVTVDTNTAIFTRSVNNSVVLAGICEIVSGDFHFRLGDGSSWTSGAGREVKMTSLILKA